MASVTTLTIPSTNPLNGVAILLHLNFKPTVSENTMRLIIKYLQEHDGKVAPHFRKLVEVRHAHVENVMPDAEEVGALDAAKYTENIPSNDDEASVKVAEILTFEKETTNTSFKPANTSARKSTTHHFNHVDDTLYAKLEKLDSWAEVEKEMEGAGLEMPAALKSGANTLYASRWARKA